MKTLATSSRAVHLFVPVILSILAFGASTPLAFAGGVLGVTQISAVQTFATADNTFANGWKWVFDVTVPTNETVLNMRFADWTNGANTIPAGSNIQFYSAQSTNASDEASAITIDAAGVYSGAMNINPGVDLNDQQGGRQIQVTVEARVPDGSSGGSYSTSYGVRSNLDTTAPTISLLGTNPQTIERTSTYTESGATATDNIDGNVAVTSDASAVHVNTVGAYAVTYSATDAAGNTSTASRTVTVVDTTAPTATVSYDVTTPTNGSVVATITPSETVTGDLSYTFTENGEHPFNFTDAAGNSGSVVATVSNIDNVAPVITIGSFDGTTPTNQNITVGASTDKGTLNATSHTFTENGAFDFVASDTAGNVTTHTVTITNIDKDAPIITIAEYNTSPTNVDVVVNASTNEGALNVTSHTFTTNGDFDFTATDAAGNVTTQKITITNIDKVAPTGTIVINGGATVTNSHSVTLTLNAGADLSGVVQMNVAHYTTYQGWESYATSKEWTLSAGDGDKEVRVKFKDAAGNVTATGILATITVDTTAPTATAAHSGNTITYTFSEPVQLVSQADDSVTPLSANLLGIYAIDGQGNYGPTPVAGITVDSATLNDNVLTITYSGSLVNQTTTNYVVDAWGYSITDLAGNRIAKDDPKQVFTVAGVDTILPTATVSAHDEDAKTIAYTFSEPVHLVNQATNESAELSSSLLGIYAIDTTTGDYGPDTVPGVVVTDATLNGNILTVTYTGNLVKQTQTTYVVDAWGYSIVDASGNRIAKDDPNQVVVIAADTTPPTATVAHDESAKTITYTFSEPMQLTENDGSAITGTIASKLAVYAVTGSDYGTATKVDGVEITNATVSGNVWTLTYIGTLVDQTNVKYVVDAWGYKIADLAGNKMLPSESAMFTVTGVDTIVPTLTVTGFTANSIAMSGSIENGYTLNTDGNAATSYNLQFAEGSIASEALKSETVGLFLASTVEQTATLQTYYSTNYPDAYEGYLKDAAAGTQPFAYIKTNGTAIQILDGAQYTLSLGAVEKDMIVPGDCPAGTYTVSGTIHDLIGNPTTVTLILKVVAPTPAPTPAASLVLTVPSTATITQSALVSTAGTQSEINAAVATAISGLTAIPVTLQNTGNDASANVRISKIDAGAHIQLWAKDTSNNWYDINVTGWIDTAGIAVPAGYSATTDVYAISDTAGSYPLTVNLVDAISPSTVVTSASGTITVNAPAVVAPTITLADVPTTITTETKATEDGNGIVTGFTATGRTPVAVTLTKGSADYSKVRIVVTGLNAGVQLIATDGTNWYNIAKIGWGPEGGFALANATTNVYLVANTAGTYTATINLVDVSNGNAVLATATASVTAETPIVSMIINSSLPTFIAGDEAPFTVSTVGNNDTGKIVRAYFTIPDGASVKYQEQDGAFYPLTNVYGPETGFPIGDVTSNFKATFTSAGTYTVKVDFKLLNGTLVATKDIVATVNAPADTTPPTFVSVSFSPTTVNVGAGSAVTTASVHITDVGTGVKSSGPRVFLTGPINNIELECGAALQSGTINDGIWTCQITIPQGSAPGMWAFTQADARDNTLNFSVVSGTEAAQLATGITVEN